MVSTPWAILLCKFNDDDSEPRTRKFYNDLFTASGNGSQNMVDFFRDISHGLLDLGLSQVFGWYTINRSLAEYREEFKRFAKLHPENPNGGRKYLTEWALEAASYYRPDFPTLDLKRFYGLVVVFNRPVDLFGSLKKVVCSDDSLKPSLLGHELGHGYGLSHSRIEGSAEDYKDPWDLMSVANTYMGSHPFYGPGSIGPGLNAANMLGRKWFDESRLWKSEGFGVNTVVELRPLHRRDLPGFLGISLDDFFIEFRMNEGWDAGFADPVVLIHYFEENTSYLIANTRGEYDLKTGSVFERVGTFDAHLKIEVLDIEVKERIAKLSLLYRPMNIPPAHVLLRPLERFGPARPFAPFRSPSEIAVVNDKIISLGHNSPLKPILKSVADFSSVEELDNEEVRRTTRMEALETIIKTARKELNRMEIPDEIPIQDNLGEQTNKQD